VRIRNNPFEDMSVTTIVDIFELKVNDSKKVTEILKILSSNTLDELFLPRTENPKEGLIYKAFNKYRNLFSSAKVYDELLDFFMKWVDRLYVGSDITITSINISDATETEAIEIFKRLNTEGIQLTKFEILAAE